MKAVTYQHYGSPDVLTIAEVAAPVPGDSEVLVKIHAATVNRTDLAIVKARPFFMRLLTGLFKPKRPVPGTEFAGEIEEVGKSVSTFKVGDRVFGFDDLGTESQAQFLTISVNKAITTMPDNVTYEEAAASIEGAHYAYNFIKKVKVRRGQKVLVYGASGAIGSAAVQLLKYYGLSVTGVCGTQNVDMVRSLGADKVVDYTQQDFTKDDERYHYIFDTVGKSSFFKCKRLLRPGGIYLSSDLGYLAQNVFLPLITPIIKPVIGNAKTLFPVPTDIKGSVLLMKKLLGEGSFKPVVDRTYPLEETVDAYRYVATGNKTGNVVIRVQ